MAVRVTCINKSGSYHENPHEAISSFGWTNEATGESNKSTREQMWEWVNRLDQARSDYDKAYGKFVSGKGNVIRQAEMLKGLGVKPGKTRPTEMIDAAMEEPELLSVN
jgi:hypothetical protein